MIERAPRRTRQTLEDWLQRADAVLAEAGTPGTSTTEPMPDTRAPEPEARGDRPAAA